jgi:hypothetical protein
LKVFFQAGKSFFQHDKLRRRKQDEQVCKTEPDRMPAYDVLQLAGRTRLEHRICCSLVSVTVAGTVGMAEIMGVTVLVMAVVLATDLKEARG